MSGAFLVNGRNKKRSPGGGEFLWVGNDKLVELLVEPLRDGAGRGCARGTICGCAGCGRVLTDRMAINVEDRQDMHGGAGDECLFRATDIFQGYITLFRTEPCGGDFEFSCV